MHMCTILTATYVAVESDAHCKRPGYEVSSITHSSEHVLHSM